VDKVAVGKMTECPPILYPDTANCSGRGICVSATECLCEPGWTGQGDFAFGAPGCDSNIAAIKGLWSLVAIMELLYLLWSILFLRIKLRQGSRAKSPILLGVLLLFCNLFLMLTGLVRAISPLRTIGSDVMVTIFFCFGAFFYWTAAHVFIYAFVELAMKQARIIKQSSDLSMILTHLRYWLPISNLASSLACFLPFGMLTGTSATDFRVYATLHYLLLATEICCCFLMSRHYVKKLTSAIDGAINTNPTKSDSLKKINWKLKRFQLEHRNQSVVNAVFALLFGLWPLLQVYGSSYFLPFAWVSGTSIGVLGLYVNLPVAEKTSVHDNSSAGANMDTTVSNPVQQQTSVPSSVIQPTLMMDSYNSQFGD
jgi:hypothetical protein